MSFDPFNFGDLLRGPGERGRRRRVLRFIDFFNRPDAVPIEGESLERHAVVAQRAVLNQILHPETAEFDWIFARECADGMIRAAGSVHLEGSGGDRFQRWYLVEFFTPILVELLDLIDRDPVSLKLIPADEWEGDVLRYARPRTAQGQGIPSLTRRLLWPAIILGAAAVVAKMFS